MNLYERIREIAKSKGYSINALEKELGYARSSISKFKVSTPGADKIKEIAEFLGVSMDSLMGTNESEMANTKYYLNDDDAGTNTEYNLLLEAKSDYRTGKFTSAKRAATYYTNLATAEMADEIKNNKELSLLFDAARDAEPEDLKMVHDMLLRLKKME